MNNAERVFKFNQILAVLERCAGRISTPMSVIMDRVSDEALEFYYRKLVRV